MSDVIKKYVCHVIFEKKRDGRFAPMGAMPRVTL